MAGRFGRIRASIVDWAGRVITGTTSAFWGEWFGGKSSSGQSVTVDTTLGLSTAWACVKLISDSVATLPPGVFKRKSDGSRVPAEDYDLYDVLVNSPNAEMTPMRMYQFLVASILLRGNAFAEQVRHPRTGRLVSLLPLLPQNMAVSRGTTGKLVYTYTDPDGGGARVIPRANVLHLRGFGIDAMMGMSPLCVGREVFGTAMSADQAAGKFFEEGMQSSGFLSSDMPLTPPQRQALQGSLTKFHGSKGAAKLMVLEGGMKYQGITLNPETAQMLQTRQYSVEEICRWFGVPPIMVGHMDKASSWASSAEAQNMQFLTTCLRPILVNIEQEIKRTLIPRNDWRKYYFEFNVEGLLRADSAGRAAFYIAALNNGWMNRNTVAKKENLPPLGPAGDVYTVQSNLIPIEDLGKTNETNQPPPSPESGDPAKGNVRDPPVGSG